MIALIGFTPEIVSREGRVVTLRASLDTEEQVAALEEAVRKAGLSPEQRAKEYAQAHGIMEGAPISTD